MRRKLFAAFCLTLAAAGCNRIPAPEAGDLEKKISEAVKAAPQRVAVNSVELDRGDRRADVLFEIPELVESKLEARFAWREYRGWELDVLRDRFGAWVPPQYVAMDLDNMRRADAGGWVHRIALALGEYAVARKSLPPKEQWRSAIAPYYAKYAAADAQRFFYFRLPGEWPERDPWGHPFEIPSMGFDESAPIPYTFTVVAPGPDGLAGQRPGGGSDDVACLASGEVIHGTDPDFMLYRR
jgi:hypothetical protein